MKLRFVELAALLVAAATLAGCGRLFGGAEDSFLNVGRVTTPTGPLHGPAMTLPAALQKPAYPIFGVGLVVFADKAFKDRYGTAFEVTSGALGPVASNGQLFWMACVELLVDTEGLPPPDPAPPAWDVYGVLRKVGPSGTLCYRPNQSQPGFVGVGLSLSFWKEKSEGTVDFGGGPEPLSDSASETDLALHLMGGLIDGMGEFMLGGSVRFAETTDDLVLFYRMRW